jgi:signal peptidase I
MQTAVQGNASIELACGLAEEIVRNFGQVRLRVFGTSMVPSILPGDLVSVERIEMENVSPGEVVLFLQSGRLFVHRVEGRSAIAGEGLPVELQVITRGDRLLHPDPPVSRTELLGRVVELERDGRKVKPHVRPSNSILLRALQSSDRITYLYLRLVNVWRALSIRRAHCQA